MGTPEFASEILKKLIEEKFEVVGVFTKPDKPVGRKQKVVYSSVKKIALEFNIEVFQPEKFSLEYVEKLKSLNLDAIVVAAYGKILPKDVLELPKYGCFNVHASLLPKFRGASPIQASIINCEEKTGISIIQMTERLDDGDILKMVETPIGVNETTLELSERLSKLGAKAMCEVLKEVLNGTETRVSQKEEDATYVSKIKKEMAKINFNLNAFAVHKLICGFSHWPTAYCYLNGKTLKVFKSRLREENLGKPGEIVSKKEFVVKCKDKSLEFMEVQLEGRKRMFSKDFLNGFKLNVGDFLE